MLNVLTKSFRFGQIGLASALLLLLSSNIEAGEATTIKTNLPVLIPESLTASENEFLYEFPQDVPSVQFELKSESAMTLVVEKVDLVNKANFNCISDVTGGTANCVDYHGGGKYRVKVIPADSVSTAAVLSSQFPVASQQTLHLAGN